MADRQCVVEPCERPAGVPGSAKGMCVGHYKKLRKYGDPLAERTLKPAVCAIDACGMQRFARDWCSKHFTRWRRFGDPLRRLKGEVRDGRRICPGCGVDTPVDEYGGSREIVARYCRRCTAANTAEWRRRNPGYGLTPKVETGCLICAASFPADRRRRITCSRRCGNTKKRLDYRTSTAVYRARKYAATVEEVDYLVVLERDGWHCYICDKSIERATRHPDPLSASVDHVIALVNNGEHSYANCRAAHLVCNLRKGARELAEIRG